MGYEEKQDNGNKDARKALLGMESFILNKLPNYSDGTKNRCVRKTRELLEKLEYDDVFTEEVNYDFCKGFTVASDLIMEYIKSEIEKTYNPNMQCSHEDIDYDER